MPRVTNQRARQAIILPGGVMDTDVPPEHFRLFDQFGVPITIGGEGAGSGLPPEGDTGDLLAKSSDSDYLVEWVPSPVPSGGATGQLLAKDTSTDYDVEWIDPPVPPVTDPIGTILDEKFDTDVSGLYGPVSPTYVSAGDQSYIHVPTNYADVAYTRDDKDDDIRNPLVILEVSFAAGSANNVKVRLREQADRYIEIKVASTQLIITRSGPSGTANVVTTSIGSIYEETRAFLMASIWHNNIVAAWTGMAAATGYGHGGTANHPLQLAPSSAVGYAANRATYTLGDDTEFYDDSHRTGKANKISMHCGNPASGLRIYRHAIYDLDKLSLV